MRVRTGTSCSHPHSAVLLSQHVLSTAQVILPSTRAQTSEMRMHSVAVCGMSYSYDALLFTCVVVF